MCAGEVQEGMALQTGRWCPEEEAGWLSWLYLGFISSLVKKGYSKPLRQEDLWALPQAEEAASQCPRFGKALASTVDPIAAPHVGQRSNCPPRSGATCWPSVA